MAASTLPAHPVLDRAASRLWNVFTSAGRLPVAALNCAIASPTRSGVLSASPRYTPLQKGVVRVGGASGVCSPVEVSGAGAVAITTSLEHAAIIATTNKKAA